MNDNAAPTVAVNRLADLTGGMGFKLEEIKGVSVTVIAIEFDMRSVHKLDENGRQLDELEDKEVCFLTIDGPKGEAEKYYTFSGPLIAKLREVNDDDLPAIATFDIKDIRGGRRVWTIG